MPPSDEVSFLVPVDEHSGCTQVTYANDGSKPMILNATQRAMGVTLSVVCSREMIQLLTSSGVKALLNSCLASGLGEEPLIGCCDYLLVIHGAV